MIEIPLSFLYAIALAIGLLTCTIGVWGVLWIFLAFIFDYPNAPSWKTAVPAGVIVLFTILCVTKVIVFV